MKRRTRYVLAAVVILAMVMACGCGDTDDEGEELTENVPDFTIEAVNRCDDEVYEIGYEAYLGDEVINSGSSINAEGGEIDSATFDFNNNDFSQGDLKDFAIVFTINPNTGEDYRTEKLTPDVSEGGDISFVISGNATDGYKAEQQ